MKYLFRVRAEPGAVPHRLQLRLLSLAARAIRESFQYVSGIQRLNSELQFQPAQTEKGLDYKEVQFLHYNLMPIFQLPIQYNSVNIGPFADPSVGIDALCAIVTNETQRPIERVYQWVGVLYTAMYGSQDAGGNWTIPASYKAFVNSMVEVKYDEGNLTVASARNWLWQTCMEFGSWTTTDNGRNMFGTELPNSYYIALCSDVFGGGDLSTDSYDVNNLLGALKGTRTAWWGANNVYTGSNTVITRGGHDPWRTLVPNVTTDSSSTIYVADGVGHAADMQPPLSSDANSVSQARSLIESNVMHWVGGSSSTSSSKA